MENILNVLNDIKEQGEFCAKRTLPADKINLEIKQFGQLKLPLSSRHAKMLIKLAKPAKFGWRNKTLLDKKVRHAWEIPKSQLKFNDKALWNKELDMVLELFKNDLGLPMDTQLKASLHNLLIYESGQFFDYHQDSEKLDNMVATLVIVLPSAHSGGTLIIDNQGDKKQFHSSRFSLDKLTLIAFYTDCHHAVKEVKEGYRLALTYNLTLGNSAKKVIVPDGKNHFTPLTESLRAYFGAENANSSSPRQFVYLLDHSYTQKGLSWHHLKNGDNVRATALKASAQSLDLEIHIALADVQETWDCETDDDPYDYRYRRHSYYEDEDEDEDEEEYIDSSDSNVTLINLINSNTVLRHWVDENNHPVMIGESNVDHRDLCWLKASDEFEPFQSEFEGFMGNYGNTMDRWYHRAAIILWQKKDHYAVLFMIDPKQTMDELTQLSKKQANREQVRQIVHSLLLYWSTYLGKNSENVTILAVFKLACYVKEAQLAQNMISPFNIKVLTPERSKLFLSLQEEYGTSWCLTALQTWSLSKDRWDSSSSPCEKIAEIIKELSESKQGHKELTDWLLTYQLKKIKQSDESCKKMSCRADLMKRTSNRIHQAMEFISATVLVSQHAIYYEFLTHILKCSALYPPLELMATLSYFKKALNKQELEQWHYQKLLNYTYQAIKNEKELGLRKEEDWSINEHLSCDCQDCNTLSEFLRADSVQNMRWPMGKERRKHIHGVIDGLGIPVTHQTEHTGSPHKLILIKTDQLYIQAKEQFARIEKAFSMLNKLIKNQEEVFHNQKKY